MRQIGLLTAPAGLCLLLLAAFPLRLSAQSPESDLAHADVPPVDYALPDVADSLLGELKVDDHKDRFSAKFGLALLAADYTDFSQDDASVAQVGEQEDEFEARSLRVMVRGHFELLRRWNYMASYEYNGFDKNDGDGNWNTTDFRISTLLGPRIGTLSLGKLKEPYVYEMVGDAANLPHHERLLSPFFRSRNIGVQFSNPVLGERATWAVGWYNDWLTEGEDWDEAGNNFAGRVTALPLWEDDGRRFLHVASSVRFNGADKGTLRMRGRPASNVADYYVDTGDIAADHSWNVGFEALWNEGPWSVLAEYVHSDVAAKLRPSPEFSGYYLTGSWVITGETRPYDRKAGYARRVLPKGKWGAWEAVARYGRVDLDDGVVQGGTMDGWWTAVNWWATRRWKASIGYGNIDLERDGLEGNTETILSRLQWIY